MRTQLLKLLLAGILLAIIMTKVDPDLLFRQVKLQDDRLLTLAFLSVPAWILLKGLKWQLLLETCIERPLFSHSICSFLVGLAIGMVTPGKVGELSRTFFIPSRNRTRVAGLVVVDRCFDFLVLLFFAAFGVLHFVGLVWSLCVIGTGIVGILVLYALNGIAKRGTFPRQSSALWRRVRDMLSALEGLNAKVSLSVSAVSGVTILLSVATSYCLLMSLAPVSFASALRVFPLVLMGNILPITFGNLGIREGSTVLLLDTYGIGGEVALSVALTLFVLHTLIPSLIGVCLLKFSDTTRT